MNYVGKKNELYMEYQRDELNHEITILEMRTRLFELFASIVCVKIDGTTEEETKRRINLFSNGKEALYLIRKIDFEHFLVYASFPS